MISRRIHVSGVVQGVGFRPFVYNLALRHSLHGEVRNTSAGVDIAVEGEPGAVQSFVQALQADAPPLARIEAVAVTEAGPNGFTRFAILESVAQPGAFQPVSPDVALCAECERELFDPRDRRYLYPFINCTHCGPRYTIIQSLPYDRPATTMAAFALCPDCEREYRDPLDRRFHAQPVACPVCGPRLELVQGGRALREPQEAVLLAARRLLRHGAILAVKGLGGFHLACDAANPAAVAELRRRKGRAEKPLAVMLAGLALAEQICEVNGAERALLTGALRPIVLLGRRPGVCVADNVAPRATTLGVMLPYTPLHHLLLNQADPLLAAEPVPPALVMTSGNLSEEPIAISNSEALERLAPLADAFLLHDRDIDQRCDDSVVRVVSVPGPATLPVRRARGYAPQPVYLPFAAPPILAVGAELKNTLCLARDRYAFLSPHIGDLENIETLAAFERHALHLARLFAVEPEIVAHDLHPDYLSTRWAQRHAGAGQRLVAVQHHHAHIAAVLADNGHAGAQPVIGLAFDGTGYGPDGAIWGGEFLAASYGGFERIAHLEYLPLPGGDAAIRKPWRIALGYAAALGLEVDDLPFLRQVEARAAQVVRAQALRSINAAPTSSLGRLFDAVAALTGLRGEVTYEAQAAIELEAAAQAAPDETGVYPYDLETVGGVTLIRVGGLLAAVCRDVRQGVPLAVIAARFQRTVSAFSVEVCRRVRAQTGLAQVALGGGVWQNVTLLAQASAGLRAAGFTVLLPRAVPSNDGGLALGQAAVAAHLAPGAE